VVKGYISDAMTGDPIEDAEIDLNWRDNQGHYDYNYTQTNSMGFYSMDAAAGEIRLYVYADEYLYDYTDWTTLDDNEILWINMSLEPKPSQTSVVKGYITDAMTGDPIGDEYVDLSWRDNQGHYDYNYTQTNSMGFYSMDAAAGEIKLYVYANGYLPENTPWYELGENETLWVNLSLTYFLDETAVLCGYIIDEITYEAVKNAYVRLDWKDDQGHFYCNYSVTDRAGFYHIHVPPGEAQLFITAYGFQDVSTSWHPINYSDVLWVNTSLRPEINITITKPIQGFYFHNTLKMPLLAKLISTFMPRFKPIIIGDIEIEANITNVHSGINRVDFYIDDDLKKSDTVEPYSYLWNESAFFQHTIKVIAYDNAGPCDIEEVVIRKFF
jgi:protocatechuate 3,4-dioxygenase beta subunit